MSITIDARGFSCPHPVMMALMAIADGADRFVVDVDHETAAENVERACREKGLEALIIKSDAGYRVEASKKK